MEATTWGGRNGIILKISPLGRDVKRPFP